MMKKHVGVATTLELGYLWTDIEVIQKWILGFGIIWTSLNSTLTVMFSLYHFPLIFITIWYVVVSLLPVLHWWAIIWQPRREFASSSILKMISLKFWVLHVVGYLLLLLHGWNKRILNNEDIIVSAWYPGAVRIMQISVGPAIFSVCFLVYHMFLLSINLLRKYQSREVSINSAP